jgi:arylsulfatase A-like enzyme
LKTIVFLADSVNRRFLSMYGNKEVKTPNLERISNKSCVFGNHWTGSSPCMPARRDLLTGRLGFMERNWGAIEAFDQSLPQLLKEKGIRSHIETDHYHYQELGGEGYCQSFTTWKMYRGQEKDNQEWLGQDETRTIRKGRYSDFYEKNREAFTSEEEFTSPKTYQAAADWLKSHGNEDDYLLWIEGFDPHEPFDIPKKYLEMYGDDYDGEAYEWPAYEPFDGTTEQLHHIRNRYKAALTFTDHWIGKVLDVCDEMNLWEDTMIVFTTDHGYMLGEHGFMAKNYMQAYNEVFHIPLFIHSPGQDSSEKIDALTQNIDLFPTIAEHHGIKEDDIANPLHGKNLFPLMEGKKEKVRDALIYGVFGKSVNVYDGRYTFLKCPENSDNLPLNLYASMPTSFNQYYGQSTIKDFKTIETGRFLEWTDFPVYKIPASSVHFLDVTQAFATRNKYHEQDYLFDLETDYTQDHNIEDAELISNMTDLLIRTMKEHDSPEEQFTRLGISARC